MRSYSLFKRQLFEVIVVRMHWMIIAYVQVIESQQCHNTWARGIGNILLMTYRREVISVICRWRK